VVGADTTAQKGPLIVTITAIGEVPEGTALLRTGARAGDLLCVSGTIGDAALGLRALQGDLPDLSAAHRKHLAERYLLPQPRLALGQALRGLATASLDISDGLIADVGHICESSGVSAEILWSAVPRSEAADPALRDLILGGGDDYELAFAIPPDRKGAVIAAAAQARTQITVIGSIGPRQASAARAKDVTVLDEFGQAIEVATPGFTHG
jgi:thiamine-monophosphate kinase